MFLLCACPRCQGDLYLDLNEFGEGEMSCIQCGFRLFSTPLASVEARSRSEPEAELPMAAGK